MNQMIVYRAVSAARVTGRALMAIVGAVTYQFGRLGACLLSVANQGKRLAVAVLMPLLMVACEQVEQPPEVKQPPKPKIQSIVVLGDSVASGEGINYDYTYYHNNFSNYISHWRGGVDNPAWEGDFPLCHDSNQAYANVLANRLGITLGKYACTGSSYANGLIAARTDGEVEYRPAQFGNWETQEFLNAEYDEVKPDVVVLTFGADDVKFVDILKFCMTGYAAGEAEEVAALAEKETLQAEIHENFVDRHAKREVLEGDRNVRETLEQSSYCTAENVGAPIEKLFWEPLNSGVIAENYKAMVAAIQARGEQAGKVPQIIFTTYHNPLPKPEDRIDCFDLADLDRAEIDYLNSLQDALNNTIADTVGSLPGVAIADISQALDGHRWCSQEPWAYGMTALIANPQSKAPFHPTPAGQNAIADIVQAVIE